MSMVLRRPTFLKDWITPNMRLRAVTHQHLDLLLRWDLHSLLEPLVMSASEVGLRPKVVSEAIEAYRRLLAMRLIVLDSEYLTPRHWLSRHPALELMSVLPDRVWLVHGFEGDGRKDYDELSRSCGDAFHLYRAKPSQTSGLPASILTPRIYADLFDGADLWEEWRRAGLSPCETGIRMISAPSAE